MNTPNEAVKAFDFLHQSANFFLCRFGRSCYYFSFCEWIAGLTIKGKRGIFTTLIVAIAFVWLCEGFLTITYRLSKSKFKGARMGPKWDLALWGGCGQSR
jgi:hypothetical protein